MQLPNLLAKIEVLLACGLRSDAARLGLREAEARLLLALEPGEEVPMTALARRLGRDPSTATRFVDRAEGDGLLGRRAGPTDRRRRVAFLLPQGEEARGALVALQRLRAESAAADLLEETGLGRGQVEWFLAALVAGLGGGTAPAQGA